MIINYESGNYESGNRACGRQVTNCKKKVNEKSTNKTKE